MRTLFSCTLLGIILSLSTVAHSDSARCYTHGKRVYDRHVHDVRYVDGILTFVEDSSDNVVFTTMDCVVKIDV